MVDPGKAATTAGTLTSIPLLTALPFDFWWVIFIPLGIVLGWAARAGKMYGEEKPWAVIQRDFIVSILIGGANAMLAALVIIQFRLPYHWGVGVAFVCAFGGVQTLQKFAAWVYENFAKDAARKAGQSRPE